MKEFNLEEFKKNPNQRVVTRDGREVRIVCTDARSNFPIVGLISVKEPEEKEILVGFFKSGKYSFTEENSSWDLFFAPEKKEGWVNVYYWRDNKRNVGNIYSSEKEAKENKDLGYITTIKIEWEE